MKKLLILFLSVLLSNVIPCSAFHADQANHGFYTPGFKVNQSNACPLQTDTNSGNDASQFTSANSEFLSRASEAALQTGNIDFSVCGWVYIDSEGANRALISKTASGGTGEYQLRYDTTSDQFYFYVGNNAPAQLDVYATTFGAVTTGTWYFVFAYFDAAADQVGISVNNGTIDTDTTAAFTPTTNAEDFRIGAYFGPGGYWNGRQQSLGFAKSKLSASTVTSLYNAGGGKKWCQLTTAEQALFTGWWELGESSGTRLDSTTNDLDLTDNNTVTGADGVTTGACACQ